MLMVKRNMSEKEITERGKSSCFSNLSLFINYFLTDRGGLLLHSIPVFSKRKRFELEQFLVNKTK